MYHTLYNYVPLHFVYWSYIKNQRCVTSQKSEDLIYIAAKV